MTDSVDVSITGIGLCTSLGGYQDACAAYRAGINRFGVHENISLMFPGEEEPSPLTIAPAANVMLGYQGVGRLVKMLTSAYQDLMATRKSSLPSEGLVVLVAMPDPEDRDHEMFFTEEVSREQRLQQYTDLIMGPLFDAVDKNLHAVPMQMVFGDRVAFARILKKASELLGQGKAEHCLLLVADSFLNERTLYNLQRSNQLKTADNPVGFIPGEGAAMLLLSRSDVPRSGENLFPQSLSLSVAIDNAAIDPEVDTETEDDEDARAAKDPSLQLWHDGKQAQLIHALVSGNYDNQIFPQLVLDLNGEEGRAVEYGLTQVALRRDYSRAIILSEYVPALSFGEQGAMAGATACAIALASIQRRYAHSREFLLFLSEPQGRRALIKLQF